jgi:lysophospholipase L1-like esterase
MTSLRILTLSICLLSIAQIRAQDPTRFQSQIENIIETTSPLKGKEGLILFTGSSSIRMWGDIQSDFNQGIILNHGFGGSQMSDLEHYLKTIVLDYQPSTIFIYEGDNDISAGKSTKTILKSAKRIVKEIHHDLPNAKVIFISPKPSLARAHLKSDYIHLNQKLEKLTRKKDYIYFADVWTPMMAPSGDVFPDLFIEDGLHMNKKGYQIWKKVMDPLMR